MRVRTPDKFSLRELHQEIDLYDRKIAHVEKFDTSDSPTEKQATIDRLQTRRETLVKKARAMAADGIEVEPRYLPRSFRTEPAEAAPAPAPEKPKRAEPTTDFGGKVLSAEAEQRRL